MKGTYNCGLNLQVYHPNIDLEGNVCLNILREDWKPVLNINTIIYGLFHLFTVVILQSQPVPVFNLFAFYLDFVFVCSNPTMRIPSITKQLLF